MEGGDDEEGEAELGERGGIEGALEDVDDEAGCDEPDEDVDDAADGEGADEFGPAAKGADGDESEEDGDLLGDDEEVLHISRSRARRRGWRRA